MAQSEIPLPKCILFVGEEDFSETFEIIVNKERETLDIFVLPVRVIFFSIILNLFCSS